MTSLTPTTTPTAANTTTTTSSNANTEYFKILQNHQQQLVLKQTGEDLANCTEKELATYLLSIQADRAKLYKTWNLALRSYCRARDKNDETSNEELQTYYKVTQDMVGAMSAASAEVKRIQSNYATRKKTEEIKLVGNLQNLEREKLELLVRRHVLLREGHDEDDTSERLGELIEELRDVVGELKLLVMEVVAEP